MACSEVLDSHFEAFLAYSSADEDKVVPLWHALKRKGYRITIDKDYDDFRPGHSAFENMTQAVENSDKTLVYLTENAINSGFVCLEIMLALEKTQRTGRVSLCLLTQFLQESEISSLKRGLLACISDINIETNRLNWEDRLISTLKGKQHNFIYFEKVPYRTSPARKFIGLSYLGLPFCVRCGRSAPWRLELYRAAVCCLCSPPRMSRYK